LAQVRIRTRSYVSQSLSALQKPMHLTRSAVQSWYGARGRAEVAVRGWGGITASSFGCHRPALRIDLNACGEAMMLAQDAAGTFRPSFSRCGLHSLFAMLRSQGANQGALARLTPEGRDTALFNPLGPPGRAAQARRAAEKRTWERTVNAFKGHSLRQRTLAPVHSPLQRAEEAPTSAG
jgi:hypothetical protein